MLQKMICVTHVRFFAFTFIVCLMGGFHQTAAQQLGAQITQARFENYTMEEGLSQNSATAILQDALGFLWVGTTVGLNRYDGYSFTQFKQRNADSTSLADDHIRFLFEDSNARLWIGTRTSGLDRFNHKKQIFEHYSIAKILNSNLTEVVDEAPDSLSAMVEVATNQFWLGTRAGLIFFDAGASEAKLVPYTVSDTVSVNELMIDRQNNLWIGDDAGRIVKMEDVKTNPGSWSSVVTYLDIEAPIQSIHETADGKIWIGSYGEGLFYYDSAQNVIKPYQEPSPDVMGLASDTTIVLKEDRHGNLWVGHYKQGVSLITKEGIIKQFRYNPTIPNGLLDDEILDIFIDRTDVIWIGTWDGLSRLSPYYAAIELHTYSDQPNGLQNERIIAFEEEEPDLYWLGTRGGGLIFFDRKTSRFTSYTANLTSNKTCSSHITGLDQDPAGYLWISTEEEGLCSLDPTRKQFTIYRNELENPHSISADDPQAVLAASDGSVWLGMWNTWVNVLNTSTKVFKRFGELPGKAGLLGAQNWPVIEDHAGNIWSGAYGKGLQKYDPSRARFDTYNLDYGNTASNDIYDLYEDSKHNIWVATDDGVKRFEPSTLSITTFRTEDGLAHNSARGLVEDNQGHIWISTNHGLSRFSPEDNSFRNFYAIDGLQSNRFYARSAMKASDGKLFWGGGKGFNIVSPEEIFVEDTQATIVLTDIRVDNERYVEPNGLPAYLTKKLDLEFDETRFSFSFANLNYVNVEQNKYRYRMIPINKGWNRYKSLLSDTSWVNLDTENVVNFKVQGYGDFEFQVLGTNGNGSWSESGLIIPITIATPWWAKWWFRVLVVITLLGIIIGAILVRTRYLLGIERLRVKIAQGLHDDIGANLATIAMKLGTLKRRLQLDEKQQRQFNSLSAMARETGQTVRETGWLINAEYDNLNRLVTQMKDLAHTMLDGQVTHSFKQSPNQMPPRRLKMEFKQNVYLLFKEALNNANKYAGASNIEIDVLFEDKKLALRIHDNGVGFSDDTIREGNGLRYMRSRAKEINGVFDLMSELGSGTTITLVAPIR